MCVLRVLVEYLLIFGPPPTFLILSFYALYLELPLIVLFFLPAKRDLFFSILSPCSSPSGEMCWILPWCFVSMDLWAIIQKIWCVLTCCNNSSWLIMINVLEGVWIKSWVLFCCAPYLFCPFVFTRQFVGSNVCHPTCSLGEWAAWASRTTTESDIFTPCLLLCCELCYMHDRKSVFTFLFSTHVYKKPATEFMYRFLHWLSPMSFFQHL